MNSGLTSHQQRGHTETGPRFKVSSERPEKRGIDSTPERSLGRAIASPPASAVGLVAGAVFPKCQSFYIKVF